MGESIESPNIEELQHSKYGTWKINKVNEEEEEKKI